MPQEPQGDAPGDEHEAPPERGERPPTGAGAVTGGAAGHGQPGAAGPEETKGGPDAEHVVGPIADRGD